MDERVDFRSGKGEQGVPVFDRKTVKIISAFSRDRTARLWDAATGKPLGEPLRHTGTVTHLAFSPDGSRLATGTEDGCIQLWDVQSGLPLSTRFKEPTGICGLAFLKDGTQLLSGCTDGVLRIHESPRLPTATPAWLPDLAEAVAGLRIGESDAPTRQGVADLRGVARPFRKPATVAPDAPYTRFARWFFADRETRTINAFSETPMSDGIAQLVRIGTIPTLEDAYRRRPTDLAIMDALATAYEKVPDSELQSNAKYLHALAQWNRESGNEKKMADFARRLRAPGGLLGPIIAPRPKEATARQVDLSEFYHSRSIAGTFTSLGPAVYDRLAKGMQDFGGIRYDIRGIIGLQSENTKHLEPSVSGIPIHQKCTKLHMLHASAWSAADGTQIGTYRLHYTDGETRDLPIRYGDDVRDYNLAKDKTPECRTAQLLQTEATNNSQTRLYHRLYENPRPEAELATLDFLSAQTTAAPYVVAITVE